MPRAPFVPRHVLVAVLLVALPAAGPLALPARAAAQGASEIVELDDGSFVRGTIVERVEGSHLVVQTVTGELRRVELARVVYAGPVEGRTRHPDGSPASRLGSPIPPPPSAPSAAARPPSPYERETSDAAPAPSRAPSEIPVRVRVRGDRRDLVLHVLTGSATGSVSQWGQAAPTTITVDAFRPLCVAPCTTDLRRGAYVFGIARGDRPARRVTGTPLQLDRTVTVELEYLDRSGERVAGWLLFFAGLLGGGTIAALPALTGADFLPTLIGGLATFGVTTLVSLPLIFFEDGAILRVLEPRPW